MRTEAAERRGNELELQLQRAHQERQQADFARRQYMADLLNAPEERVLAYLRETKAKILAKDREKDRDNDLEM